MSIFLGILVELYSLIFETYISISSKNLIISCDGNGLFFFSSISSLICCHVRNWCGFSHKEEATWNDDDLFSYGLEKYKENIESKLKLRPS